MNTPRRLASLLPLAAWSLSACSPAAVTVEVLPPRTSITCGAPSVTDPASSRGLLDVRGTEVVHGAYRADLRLSVKGADARVDGVSVKTKIKGADLGDFDGAVVGGDTVLLGKEDDVRTAVVENAELLSRDAAAALLDDDDLDLSAIDFATITVTLTPVLRDAEADGLDPQESTFALDVCDGCLVTPPSEAQCPAGVTLNPVCRPGQDQKLFGCATGGA